MELIEDTGIGSCDVEEMADQLALLDLPGIDILSHSILVGVEGWMTASEEPEELRNECWVEPFLHLVELLERWAFRLCVKCQYYLGKYVQHGLSRSVTPILLPCD